MKFSVVKHIHGCGWLSVRAWFSVNLPPVVDACVCHVSVLEASVLTIVSFTLHIGSKRQNIHHIIISRTVTINCSFIFLEGEKILYLMGERWELAESRRMINEKFIYFTRGQ